MSPLDQPCSSNVATLCKPVRTTHIALSTSCTAHFTPDIVQHALSTSCCAFYTFHFAGRYTAHDALRIMHGAQSTALCRHGMLYTLSWQLGCTHYAIGLPIYDTTLCDVSFVHYSLFKKHFTRISRHTRHHVAHTMY